ncbi:MAG: hypothetical protein CFE24_13975 [Flavobacterium sp. BFFFF2]|nr:MAG: hypothetical protein CFE24_13975 [Flavobacterium sp. BFFFF2]
MIVHKLNHHDFEEPEYVLLALRAVCEPYQIAFLLNSYVGTHFKRIAKELEVPVPHGIAHFERFQYKDQKLGIQWDLIANKGIGVQTADSSVQTLFDLPSLPLTSNAILISEMKQIDCWLTKTMDEYDADESELVQKMKQITQFQFVGIIDSEKVKTKYHTVFDS